MNISETNKKRLRTLIKELFELAEQLPNLCQDVINTNIHYRAWILDKWSDNFEKDIQYEYEETLDEVIQRLKADTI